MNASNLQDIENLMERSRKKRLLGFLGRHRDIAAEVYRLRDDLEDTIKLFMVRNHKYIYTTSSTHEALYRSKPASTSIRK